MRLLEVTCPSCSPEVPVEHEVLSHKRGSGGRDIYVEAVVECAACGTVHRAEIRVPKPIEVDAVVSREGESSTLRIEMFPDEEVRVGDEIEGFEVTAIETGGGRVESAPADEIETVWGREITTVEVPVSLHMGGETVSEKVEVEGDDWIEVDQSLRRRGLEFTVQKILTESGEEERAQAKDVKRVYADSRNRGKR